MKKNKAFNIVNVMIVVCIVGLLSAMTIPAFLKVRERQLVHAYQNGEKLTLRQEQSIAGLIGGPKASTISVNGKTYYLFPKNTPFEEIRLKGTVYILVPTQ